jgi:subtilisin family serine protease
MASPLVATQLLWAGCSYDAAVIPDRASDRAPEPPISSQGRYLLAGRVGELPSGLERQVVAAGGTLVAAYPEVGLAIARSGAPEFATQAARIPGIQHAVADQRVAWLPPLRTRASGSPGKHLAGSAIEDGAGFFEFQWGPRAIEAPAAWAAGHLGAGARVAVLDGGIWAAHPDLAPNIDVARATSFATDANGAPTEWDEDVGSFWHGTHVAGIVAGAAALGTIGIAPRATIIPVKVLHDGSGTFGGLIQAIVYASTPISQGGAGAHIINLSLGAEFIRQGRANAQLASFLSRVTSFARRQGTLVIAATGNSALDLDHTANLVSVPAQSVGVLAIAATGPVNVAGGGTNFDRPASYTNFGQSAVHLAGPGGDFALFPNGDWFLDMVLSTNVNGWAFAAGTSMAAPATAGVAALVVGRYGALPPAQLEARLRASSDDLGKPGHDAFYGAGRINARKAVQ